MRALRLEERDRDARKGRPQRSHEHRTGNRALGIQTDKAGGVPVRLSRQTSRRGMTLVAIHQPNYAPWLGYFHKLAQADVFVFLDDAQFSKGSYTNRVQV